MRCVILYFWPEKLSTKKEHSHIASAPRFLFYIYGKIYLIKSAWCGSELRGVLSKGLLDRILFLTYVMVGFLN